MPLLHDVEIDWGWPQLREGERAIVRRHEALLQADRKSHTVDTAERALLAAARELPGRSPCAPSSFRCRWPYLPVVTARSTLTGVPSSPWLRPGE